MKSILRTSSWMRVVAVVAIAAIVIGACSAQDDSSGFKDVSENLGANGAGGEATATTFAASTAATDAEAPETDETELGRGGVTPVALPTNIGRDIIFTSEMTVAVADVAGAGDEATRIVQSLGGFLFGQQTSGSPDPTSVLIFKVQPQDFQTALTRLGSIGEIRSQNVTASDVTDRIVDLESRISTATASVERLRALLAEATDIKAIVELESELLARETELETLRGSLRTLQDQVSLATITLVLTEAASHPALAFTVTAYPAHDAGVSCPGDGGLTLETSMPATLCFEIVNTGDTWLADFELRDPVLDVELSDLTVVFGDPSGSLEPGDSMLLALEVEPERDLRTQTTITAVPVDIDGVELPGRPATQTTSAYVDTVDPGGIATFGEGLEASWDLLVRVGQLLVLVAGAIIPFFWIPLLIWMGWR
ncbi:MAG: DUF4349 domain-containing protein, partial [Acidimicrobiia bacterium]